MPTARFKGRDLKPHKAAIGALFGEKTVLTSSPWEFVRCGSGGRDMRTRDFTGTKRGCFTERRLVCRWSLPRCFFTIRS
jgi:hypothetical protein